MLFDCFTFFNELDILEARLHEMSPVVDRFVLVEATKTFTGKPKPLYFAENIKQFAPFLDRIEHVVVEFPDNMSFMLSGKCYNEAWAREWYQRQQMVQGLHGAANNDLVIVSDVDEIISADALKRAVSDRRRGDLAVFTMPVYTHAVNRRVRCPEWTLGPRMTERSYVREGQAMRMTKLRASRNLTGNIEAIHTRVWNWLNCGVPGRVRCVTKSGWHISSIGGWQSYRKKVEAYSHFDRVDSDEYRSLQAYMRHVFATTDEADISELPKFIQENPAMFPHMNDDARVAT